MQLTSPIRVTNVRIILSIKRSPADTIELRQVPRRIIDSLKKDDAFWYVDHVFDKEKAKEKNYRSAKPPLQWMNMTTLLVIVLVFLGILAWYLVQNNIVRRKELITAEKISADTTGENIFDINYQKEIEKAVNARRLSSCDPPYVPAIIETAITKKNY